MPGHAIPISLLRVSLRILCFPSVLCLVATLLGAAPAWPQSGNIYVTNNSAGVSAGSTIYIDDSSAANFPMPQVSLSLQNLTVAPNRPNISWVVWTVQVAYTDTTTFTVQDASYWSTGPSDLTWNIGHPSTWPPPSGLVGDQASADLGGQVTVTIAVYGPGGTTTGMPSPSPFTFYIAGKNPSESNVDSYYRSLSASWLFGSMIASESGGQQFNASGQRNTNSNSNGSTDYGLLQLNNYSWSSYVDAVLQSTNDLIWNYQVNISDSLSFSSTLATSGSNSAYQF